MIGNHVLIAGLTALIVFSGRYGVIAQPDLGARDHFQSRLAELRKVIHGQEHVRERLAWREATALGPKFSWTLMVQGAGFRQPVPAAATLNIRVHTHWSAGLGWFDGPLSGPVLQTDASVGRWIMQGKLVHLRDRNESSNSRWLAGMGLRRRQLITPGLWMYALAEYQWQHPMSGGSLTTWVGLEWEMKRPEGRSRGRFPTRVNSATAVRRLSTAIRGWPKRGIFD